MVDHNSPWDTSVYDPNVKAGPGVDPQQIADWEEQRGVALPPALRRAYLQQDGGYIRGGRALWLLPLAEIEPVEDGYLDGLCFGNEDGRLDAGVMLYLGGDDDQGATLLLHYDEARTVGPAVYMHWSDGDAMERLVDTVEMLFASQ